MAGRAGARKWPVLSWVRGRLTKTVMRLKPGKGVSWLQVGACVEVDVARTPGVA